MLRARRRVRETPAPGQGVGQLVAAGAGMGAVVVTVAIVAIGGPDRILPLIQAAADQASIIGTVAAIRFYGGVGALVTLSMLVIAGLLAADRVLLDARRRLWAQSVHRTLGVLTVILLATHVVTELTANRVEAFAAVVPFVSTSLYLGLGSVAAYLMFVAMWTGLVRARFAERGRPGMWRILHAAGYVSWPVALLHGLRAGRSPAPWVVASYLVLLVVVALALGLRMAAERRHRRTRAARTMAGVALPSAAPLPHPVRMDAVRSGPLQIGGAPALQSSGPAGPMQLGPVSVSPAVARPASVPFGGGAGSARPVSVPVAGSRAPARLVPEQRRQPAVPVEVPMAVSLDLRRTARTGRGGEHDEVDERYLAALRGETR